MLIAPDRGPVLQAIDVAKSYGGVRALRGATLELCAGEVHGLVGENGAGKSTLIKILTGAVRPDGGEIVVEGRPLLQHSPRAAKARATGASLIASGLVPTTSLTSSGSSRSASAVEPTTSAKTAVRTFRSSRTAVVIERGKRRTARGSSRAAEEMRHQGSVDRLIAGRVAGHSIESRGV